MNGKRLAWYARVDSNHRPFAPEAKGRRRVFKHLCAFCEHYADTNGFPAHPLSSCRSLHGDDVLPAEASQMGGTYQLLGELLQYGAGLFAGRVRI
jgi:hypothetical protein